MVSVMSRHKHKHYQQPQAETPRQLVPSGTPETPRADNVPAEPRAYTSDVRNLAPPCTACQAFLAKHDPPRKQATRVYCRRGNVQYVICDNCGATWKAVVT